MTDIKPSEFLLLVILVVIVVGSLVWELKPASQKVLACYAPEPIDDCIRRQSK